MLQLFRQFFFGATTLPFMTNPKMLFRYIMFIVP